MAYKRGFLQDVDFSGEHVEDISALTREVFFNQHPLLSRFPHVDGDAIEFKILTYAFRPRTYTLTAAIADGVATSASLNDVSPLVEGDVLWFPSGERVEVTAVNVTNASTGAGTVTIVRGVSGSTAAAQASAGTVRLVGNSQRGNEVAQSSARTARTANVQWHQRSRRRVSMGGETAAVKNVVLPGGYTDPFDLEKEVKLVEMLDDAESSMYFGMGEAPTAGGNRRKQKGLRQLVGHLTDASDITDEAAYTPDSLIRDLFQPIIDNGGEPGVVLMSTGWVSGLHKWGYLKTGSVPLGSTQNLGIRISGYVLPFSNRDIVFIPAPLLNAPDNSHSAICLTTEEVAISDLENESWHPVARTGDVREGEWIYDGCIRLENPEHHSMVEGITGFSAS
jgi:hypothetical protein